ncbi:MAG: uroporphyrinogen-III synthase [Salinirussus sp.]
MTESRPTVAVFRPDDGRLAAAVETVKSLGGRPMPDAMLSVEPTDAIPRTDADVVILTSSTGARLVSEMDWQPGDSRLAAIGETTADTLREAGYSVDLVPDEYSSAGLVAALRESVDGARIEVARSDHGSAVLLDGLEAGGAYIHETVLYRLERPTDAGASVEAAAAGDLDAALFTSSLTVEHFLTVADERDCRASAIDGLSDATVGAIGTPTADTAREAGITVDVVPDVADFEQLARAVLASRPNR